MQVYREHHISITKMNSKSYCNISYVCHTQASKQQSNREYMINKEQTTNWRRELGSPWSFWFSYLFFNQNWICLQLNSCQSRPSFQTLNWKYVNVRFMKENLKNYSSSQIKMILAQRAKNVLVGPAKNVQSGRASLLVLGRRK